MKIDEPKAKDYLKNTTKSLTEINRFMSNILQAISNMERHRLVQVSVFFQEDKICTFKIHLTFILKHPQKKQYFFERDQGIF